VEGQNLEIRLFLDKYESVMEGQRQRIQERRQAILESDQPELERLVAVRTIDDLWSVYLETVTELRAGIHWQGYTGHDPLYAYLTKVDALYCELEESIDPETAVRLEEARAWRPIARCIDVHRLQQVPERAREALWRTHSCVQRSHSCERVFGPCASRVIAIPAGRKTTEAMLDNRLNKHRPMGLFTVNRPHRRDEDFLPPAPPG
jgi:preprotein translocase subunit SecA